MVVVRAARIAAWCGPRQNGSVSDNPRFDQINLVVRDMPAMLDFHAALGLDIADSDPSWAEHHRTATTQDGVDVDFDSQPFAQ